MDLLQVAKLHGLEPIPRLDDISELKQLLTPGVLIILKEKYEIPDQETYTFEEYNMCCERFLYLYVEIATVKFIEIGRGYKTNKFEIRNGIFPSWMCVCWHQTLCGKIIPLRINSNPLDKKEQELVLLYMQQKRMSFIKEYTKID